MLKFLNHDIFNYWSDDEYVVRENVNELKKSDINKDKDCKLWDFSWFFVIPSDLSNEPWII